MSKDFSDDYRELVGRCGVLLETLNKARSAWLLGIDPLAGGLLEEAQGGALMLHDRICKLRADRLSEKRWPEKEVPK